MGEGLACRTMHVNAKHAQAHAQSANSRGSTNTNARGHKCRHAGRSDSVCFNAPWMGVQTVDAEQREHNGYKVHPGCNSEPIELDTILLEAGFCQPRGRATGAAEDEA